MPNNVNTSAGTQSQKFAPIKGDDILIYYDRLPVRLRRAVQEANHCYSPKHVYKLYREVGLDKAIRAIQRNDQKIAAEYYETFGGAA